MAAEGSQLRKTEWHCCEALSFVPKKSSAAEGRSNHKGRQGGGRRQYNRPSPIRHSGVGLRQEGPPSPLSPMEGIIGLLVRLQVVVNVKSVVLREFHWDCSIGKWLHVQGNASRWKEREDVLMGMLRTVSVGDP